eukprot:6496953-Prymnesium_polylepis.1
MMRSCSAGLSCRRCSAVSRRSEATSTSSAGEFATVISRRDSFTQSTVSVEPAVPETATVS